MQKALSVRQPYAWLIVAGHKAIENRTWNTHYRGPLLIHAAKKPHEHDAADILKRYGVRVPADLTTGAVIGVVELVDVVTSHDSPWFSGPFGFILAKPRVLKPRPCLGKVGMFSV